MATFDARKNFAKVTVSTGYAAGATSIVLASGHGAKLPQPSTDNEFNLVWWNNSDYGDPSDDPNKEIVRCTARTTDTLTITRAQESTGDSLKNIAAKTYRMALTITEKVIDDIIDSLGASSTISVNQTTHGFAVGDALRSSGTDNEYAKALADSATNAEAIGMVTTVTDADNFIITTSGLIDVAAAVPSATAGDVLFLDPSTAGAVTTTEPTVAGQVSKPIGIVTADDTEMVYVNFRGSIISDTDFPSQTYITVKMGTEADGDDNQTFSLTTGTFTAGKYLSVYKNGALQEEGASADYQTSGTTIAVFNSVVLDTDKITLIVRSYTVEGMEDPLTTEGDVVYRNATVPARLAIGTNGQVLATNSGATAPEWIDPNVKATGAEINTGTDDAKFATPKAIADSDLADNPMTTQGDVVYGGTSGAETRLGVGTAGQILTTNSGATAPEWADAGGGMWTLVTSGTFSTNQSITGLDGDSDKIYKLFIKTNHSSETWFYMRWNNDTGNNYYAGTKTTGLDDAVAVDNNDASTATSSFQDHEGGPIKIAEYTIYAARSNSQKQGFTSSILTYKQSSGRATTQITTGMYRGADANLTQIDFVSTVSAGNYFLYKLSDL